MKLLQMKIPAGDMLELIDKRLNKVAVQYAISSGKEDKVSAEAMAETKWQLAELKMQFVDLLTEKLDEEMRNDRI